MSIAITPLMIPNKTAKKYMPTPLKKVIVSLSIFYFEDLSSPIDKK